MKMTIGEGCGTKNTHFVEQKQYGKRVETHNHVEDLLTALVDEDVSVADLSGHLLINYTN